MDPSTRIPLCRAATHVYLPVSSTLRSKMFSFARDGSYSLLESVRFMRIVNVEPTFNTMWISLTLRVWCPKIVISTCLRRIIHYLCPRLILIALGHHHFITNKTVEVQANNSIVAQRAIMKGSNSESPRLTAPQNHSPRSLYICLPSFVQCKNWALGSSGTEHRNLTLNESCMYSVAFTGDMSTSGMFPEGMVKC